MRKLHELGGSDLLDDDSPPNYERRREYTRREYTRRDSHHGYHAHLQHGSQLTPDSSAGSLSPPINVTTPPLSSGGGGESSNSAWHTPQYQTLGSAAQHSPSVNATNTSATYTAHHLLTPTMGSSFRATAEYSTSSAFIQLANAASTSATTSAAQMLSAHQQATAHSLQHNHHAHSHSQSHQPHHQHHHQRLSAAAAVSAMDQVPFIAKHDDEPLLVDSVDEIEEEESTQLHAYPAGEQLTEQFAVHRTAVGSAVEVLNGLL
ncbi:unnamed protein product [Ceratitis capitata]|uniref:(Mediterranean fruit fly) hypothetical protein n=1 Tax=Ceratitis capitata TaxID=7213 RepID=A0A811UJU2_CERCA|nr:unnamed protein product [Ceratitis capitata]